jgi:hypothetical protein
MNQILKEAFSFLKKTREIKGWLSIYDYTVFQMIGIIQDELNISGDILEIGAYQGKSSVVLGNLINSDEKLYICDIFSKETDLNNKNEIIQSYDKYERNLLEANLVKFSSCDFKIFECNSLDLPKILTKNKFRLIHLDGSHLYSIVSKDLHFMEESALADNGIIAVDDFRTQHTLGVSFAVWESIIQSNLVPVLVTPQKMYLIKKGFELDLDKIEIIFQVNKIEYIKETIKEFSYLRILGIEFYNQFSYRQYSHLFIPKIFFLIKNSFLRSLRKSLLKPRISKTIV